MAEISANIVNELRKRSGVGMMECKKALVESGGDMEAAMTLLRKKGAANAAKRAGREASEGTIQSYIHGGGRIGVLVELSCETDFVGKNEEFQKLAKDICVHIAASSPLYISADEIPPEVEAREREIAMSQCADKPANAIEKIVAGKLAKWRDEVCLLNQPFIINQEISVGEYILQNIAKIGENIKVRRFVRYQVK